MGIATGMTRAVAAGPILAWLAKPLLNNQEDDACEIKGINLDGINFLTKIEQSTPKLIGTTTIRGPTRKRLLGRRHSHVLTSQNDRGVGIMSGAKRVERVSIKEHPGNIPT